MCNILDPTGQDVPVKIAAIHDNKFRVEFTPEKVGELLFLTE